MTVAQTRTHEDGGRARDGRGRRRVGAVTIGVMLVALVAACVPPTVPDPYEVRARLVDEGFELSWKATASGSTHGYQLQYRRGNDSWTNLPTPSGNSASFTDVEPRTRYTFRVRHLVAPGSPVAEWSQQAVAYWVDFQLPVVRIDTVDDAPILDKENYVRATMQLDPNGTDVAAYSGTLGIRGRGNSTWGYPKKPYRLKLDTASPMMGIASNRDWVLLANYVDRSQLRTHVASQISHLTDLDWSPTFHHVEVVLNGVYQGVYQFTEHVRLGENRVDIEEMGPGDNTGLELTGGYLLEIDHRLEVNNEPGFRTTKNVAIVVKDPDPMTWQQRAYIRDYVQGFEDVLYSANYQNPATGYRSRLDVAAFIDHWILQEVTRNGDSFWYSTFFTKERGDPHLRFGPMWDFDRSLGTDVTAREQLAEGWYARYNGPWVRRLFTDPAFVAELKTRWHELAPQIAELVPQIESLGTELRPAIENDMLRWGLSALKPVDEPEYIADWLATRVAWLTTAFDTDF